MRKLFPLYLAALYMALLAPLGATARPQSNEEVLFTLPNSVVAEMSEFWGRQAELAVSDEALVRRLHAIQAERENPMQDLLNKGPHSLENALFWISAVPHGRALLANVIPIWKLDPKKQGLHFASARDPDGKRLNQNAESMAFFFQDTVYIDYEFSFIVLVASMFHELVHAQQILVDKGGKEKQAVIDRLNNLDNLYRHWSEMGGAATGMQIASSVKTMRDDLSKRLDAAKEEAYPILINMEHQAYRMQDTFIGELFQLGDQFRVALADRIQARQWLAFPVSETLFRGVMRYERGMNIPEPVLDKYFKDFPFSSYE
ncbi:MAG: hypothetical protein H6617_09850 [Bdellovibrionaceae bacterium]|nr:hypothetical protein [Bdellovibrionales bacterium]MCB9254973.1 hypothetical protein [Pseudobdellovibrionaceae bacterium]